MNLAARLQAIAQPGSLVVSERVRRLAGGAFDYEDLGEQTLKGIAQPTHAYRIVGISEAASRFEATHQEGLTPLVGREQELALLLERWQLAQDGDGQVVLLSGEPAAVRRRHDQDAVRRRRDAGSDLGKRLEGWRRRGTVSACRHQADEQELVAGQVRENKFRRVVRSGSDPTAFEGPPLAPPRFVALMLAPAPIEARPALVNAELNIRVLGMAPGQRDP
jgi:hypothetical protein